MLLFVDESGIDRAKTPYEILGGIALRQHNLWNFILSVQEKEMDAFGVRLKDVGVEMKGKKMLKRKRFRLAAQLPPIDDRNKRRDLAMACLVKGLKNSAAPREKQTREEITAYSQAALYFVDQLIDLCFRYDVKVFASIVNPDAPRPDVNVLHKDYSYLFERYFNYVEDTSRHAMGMIVFDELEKAQARILVNQMGEYFLKTQNGRERSARIIPEPFFVHSDLTTAIQVADILIYILNWGYRKSAKLKKICRDELVPYAERIHRLQHNRAVEMVRDKGAAKIIRVYSITYIDSLRPISDSDKEEE